MVELRRRLSLSNSKKGNAIVEGILFIVVLFAIALMVQFIYPVFTEMNTAIQEDDDLSDTAKERSDLLHTRYNLVFDGGFASITILVWIGSLIASWFIDAHPVFFILTFLLLMVMLWVGAELANAYDDIVSGDETMNANKSKFPITNFIFGHFLETLLVVFTSYIILLFAKFRSG